MEWTDEQRATLRAGREAGKTFNAIAKELGITKNAVVGRARRMGLPAHNPTGTRLPGSRQAGGQTRYQPWDDETTTRFIQVWTTRDDINRRKIAKLFGVSEDVAKSRAAALGIVRCVHWSQQPGPKKKSRVAAIPGPLPTMPKPVLVYSAPKPVIQAPLSKDDTPLVFRPRPPRACCWPLWGHDDAPTHRYCDAPAEDTYCDAHRAVAFVGRVRRGTEFVFAGLRG